ncbi:unnamed protein product [Darwinula stevensoni]|uniref:Ubiquitin-like modifier-activating enzyme ATG7 n=1 Tax=Darwinula stevensoni TaxID=69355 RepID=A0A7R9ABR1_9CRUS|nr:unnamed protein product [Darwinula stevensoni]CAG0899101.1 unnamed protein product [Darwinula stevensoni]
MDTEIRQKSGAQLLQYAPFSSCVDPRFWYKLSQLKLEKYKLSEESVNIDGFFSNVSTLGMGLRVSVDESSFERNSGIGHNLLPMRGTLMNKNTLDGFRDLDKKALLQEVGKELWKQIQNGQALENPTILNSFLLLTFADLKKYRFYFWFAFPALLHPSTPVYASSIHDIAEEMNPKQVASLGDAYSNIPAESPSKQFFIVTLLNDNCDIASLATFNEKVEEWRRNSATKFYLGFADPSQLEANPGWSLRNFIALIHHLWYPDLGDEVKVLCLRMEYGKGGSNVAKSICVTVQLSSLLAETPDFPGTIGWEKNLKGNMGPRMADLSSSLDPIRLAESAVSLNLQLMRWRLVPSLDLEKVEQTRCLLLGAGTLGCNIARCLLGWGVREITFVDSGKISFSNPVRQSLFVHEDCLEGGKNKAEAAARALQLIFPPVRSRGEALHIPMPGHPVSKAEEESLKSAVARLEELVASHDVVFLVMDSRESRWLPTLLGAVHQKLVITAALGFDSFLVMRHGLKTCSVDPGGDSPPLACYFCGDVVAPGNSMKARTLDQQCTVTRPGISMIAAAYAAELAVSVIQHPLGGGAPGISLEKFGEEDVGNEREADCVLGKVPHMIRGFLSAWHQLGPATPAFSQCTACSEKVIEAYKSEGLEFLLKVFESSAYLEELTGLKKLQEESFDAEVWVMDDTDDDETEDHDDLRGSVEDAASS